MQVLGQGARTRGNISGRSRHAAGALAGRRRDSGGAMAQLLVRGGGAPGPRRIIRREADNKNMEYGGPEKWAYFCPYKPIECLERMSIFLP